MPDEFTTINFTLDSIASDLIIIPIKGDMPLYRYAYIEWFNPYFYYSSPGHGKIYRIDTIGNVVDVLDKRGRGRGEYLYLSDFFIDCPGNIYVSNAVDKIIVYNNMFAYLYDIDLPVERDGLISIRYLNDQIHAFYFHYSGGGYSWMTFDSTGYVLDSERNFDIYKPNRVSYPTHVFENNNKLYRFLFSNDTIFEVDSTGYHPYRIINRNFKDGFNLNHDYETDFNGDPVPDKKRVIRSIFGIGDYWLINFQKLQSSVHYRLEETVLYDYTQNKYYLVASDQEIDRSISVGLRNDWIGIGTFFPMNTLRSPNHKFLVSVREASKYLELTSNENFNNSHPVRPEIKRRMESIRDTLTLDDNPVMFFLKLNK
jgi:hypothetical protein